MVIVLRRPLPEPTARPMPGVAGVLPGAGLPPELLHDHGDGTTPAELLTGILRLPDHLLPPVDSRGGDLLLAELTEAMARPLEGG